MSAKGEQAAAAAEVVAWRVIDADGRPATDWIDGDGRGREPFVAGGRVQLAYASAERARTPADLTMTRGYLALRNAVACLRAEARFVDEEGEDTDAIEALLDALAAAPSQPEDAEATPQQVTR